jgi:histone H3/H4
MSKRAGLSLSCAKTNRVLKASSKRVSQGAGVFLTAAIESILADVVAEAVASTAESNVSRVGVNSLAKAIRCPDSSRVFRTYTLSTNKVLSRPGNLLLTKMNKQKKMKASKQ